VADVKWIKLIVGMFDGMSFKKIKKAKIGGESFRDKLTAVWFELLDFAGKCNHNGAFIDSREIPFVELSDIAMMIDREEDELELCMAFFINEGMISIVDDVYMLSTWSEYQNTDGLDKIREQNRLRQAKFKQKQKLLQSGNVTDNVTVTQGNATDIDIEEDKEREEDNNILSPSPKAKKPVKHKYGEYQNVLLTDEELEKLKDEYFDYEERIERLSTYIESSGKKYKSHYATIRMWAKKDKPTPVQAKPQNSTDAFFGELQRLYDEEC
jgi:predicted phage replisome organizer